MEKNIEHLQYPIGRYQKPQNFDPTLTHEWIEALKALPSFIEASIENLNEQQLNMPYREGGWTVQQVVHHVADVHMNALIRLKLALTEDNPTVSPYNEKIWVELEDSKAVPANISVTLIYSLHYRMVALLQNMAPEDWERTYYHPQQQRNCPIWEMIALYAWHGKHHTSHIIELRKSLNLD